LVAADESDISDLNVTRADALYQQRVPRPKSRKHAPTGCGKPKIAEGAQRLNCKSARYGISGIRCSAQAFPHDTFVGGLVKHCIWVPDLLHVRADVTKASS
jgi:hypothetical protein